MGFKSGLDSKKTKKPIRKLRTYFRIKKEHLRMCL
jgi:hypothetical protein